MQIMALICSTAFVICVLVVGVFMEPECSKYDYEEKLLYKMVKTEFEWKAFQNDVKTELSDVKTEVLKAKQEINGAVEDIRKVLDTIMSEQSKTETVLDKQRNDTINTLRHHEGQLDELRINMHDFVRKMQQNISDFAKNPMVAFNAKDVKDRSPVNGDTIIFTTSLLNEGNAYDTSSGVFTAQVPGLYSFTVQLCSYSKQYITASIFVAGEEYGRLLVYDNSGSFPCNSAQALAIMQPGDEAFIRRIYGSNGRVIDKDSHRESFFTGILIH